MNRIGSNIFLNWAGLPATASEHLPRFEGAREIDDIDGVDGVDGIDGVEGIDGVDGIDGSTASRRY